MSALLIITAIADITTSEHKEDTLMHEITETQPRLYYQLVSPYFAAHPEEVDYKFSFINHSHFT